MKLFTNKKIIQKMTIVLVFLILFNFIAPNCVRAEDTAIESAGKVIFTPVRGFLVMCGDAVMNGLQYLFVSNEKAVLSAQDVLEQKENFLGEDESQPTYFEYVGENIASRFPFLGEAALDLAGFEEVPNFKYTPQSIFEGSVKAFKINFINGGSSSSNSGSNNSSTDTDTTVSVDTSDIEGTDWYKAYVTIVDQFKADITTALSEGNEDKARAALQILKFLGVSGVNTVLENKSVDGITYTPLEAKRAVKSLAAKYFNGENRYTLFAFDEAFNNDINKFGLDYVDNTMLIGMIGLYKQESGIADSSPTMGPERDYDSEAPINALHNMISTWYKIMRNIALVFLLSILVYIGIRIMISSTAADSAKYKKMLINWVVALCILFVLHYIMAFTSSAIDLVTSAFSTGSDQASWTDDIFGMVRLKLQSDSLSDQFFYTLLYLVLVIYTAVFTFYYLKRVVYAAFLTLIAPLVSLTYPIDKMGDGKSQAFDMWLKEYIANAIIQPVHLLIYTVLVSSVFTLAESNPLYAIVVMGAMMPTEKFIREMFNLNSKRGPGPAGSFAGGALAASAFNKLLGKPPIPPHHKNGEATSVKPEKEEKSKVRMNDDTTSDYARMVAGQDTKSTENKQDIDNGNFKTSREMEKDEEIDNELNPIREDGGGTDQMDGMETPTGEKMDAELEPIGEYGGGTSQMDGMETPTGEKMDAELNPIREADTGMGQDEEIEVSQRENTSNNSTSAQYSQSTRSGEPIDAIHITPRSALASNKNKDAKKALRKQKSTAKKAAKKKYYAAKNKQQLKQLGKFGKGVARGALKVAGGAVLGAAGATVGLAAAVTTGDPSNVLKYGGSGVLAGAKGGASIGNFVYEVGENSISNSVNASKQKKQMWKDDLYNHSELYREELKAKEAKKFVKSAETKAAIKERFKSVNNFDMKNAMDTFSQYKQAGIKDLDTMLNVYGLEQGIDAYGNKLDTGKISHEQAILAGKMAERYEVGNSAARKSTKEELELQLAHGYYENSYDENTGKYSLTESESVKQGKEKAKETMKIVDLAQGIEVSKAGFADTRDTLKKKREDTKAKEDYMATQAWKDEYRNMKIETKNGSVTIKNSIINNGINIQDK